MLCLFASNAAVLCLPKHASVVLLAHLENGLLKLMEPTPNIIEVTEEEEEAFRELERKIKENNVYNADQRQPHASEQPSVNQT